MNSLVVVVNCSGKEPTVTFQEESLTHNEESSKTIESFSSSSVDVGAVVVVAEAIKDKSSSSKNPKPSNSNSNSSNASNQKKKQLHSSLASSTAVQLSSSKTTRAKRWHRTAAIIRTISGFGFVSNGFWVTERLPKLQPNSSTPSSDLKTTKKSSKQPDQVKSDVGADAGGSSIFSTMLEKLEFKCHGFSPCDKVFEDEQKLKRHIRNHKRSIARREAKSSIKSAIVETSNAEIKSEINHNNDEINDEINVNDVDVDVDTVMTNATKENENDDIPDIELSDGDN